jgi:heme/copper-type cytochrome/quinol oxidase subunit 2
VAVWLEILWFVIQVAIVWWLAWEAFKNSERANALAKLAKDTMDNNDDLIAANMELLEQLQKYEKHPSPFEKPFTNAHSGMGVKDNVQG